MEVGCSIASYLGRVTQYMKTVWTCALQYTFYYSRTSRSRALEYNMNTATLVLYRGFKMYGNYRNEVFWDLKLSFVDRTVFAIRILILRVHNWRFHCPCITQWNEGHFRTLRDSSIFVLCKEVVLSGRLKV